MAESEAEAAGMDDAFLPHPASNDAEDSNQHYIFN